MDEFVSSFISYWNEKAINMIKRPIEIDQIDMFLRSLQPRLARHLMGTPFQDFRSLGQALFKIEKSISRGLWLDIIPPSNAKDKRVVRSSKSQENVCSTSFQH